jgi:phenylpropionate dioxygenase-like ring-hydroxylating dioxygenase large terminal subunit
VHPFTLLPGAVDEPLLLTRDQSDQVHCISNVCTHRGTLVVEGPGHEQQLRCRYHGRRFTLDGRFQSMPEFEQTANFPSPSDDLPRVSLGTWTRFHMVSLAPAMPFADLVSTPLAVHRTRVSFLPFVWDPNKRETGAGAGLDRVEREDEAVVESVQRGVRSRLYDRGRYSPAREGGVHHFHRLLAEFLTA